jgi:hypothetical protein
MPKLQETERVVIEINDREFAVWQFADGSYRLPYSEVASCVGASATQLHNFVSHRSSHSNHELNPSELNPSELNSEIVTVSIDGQTYRSVMLQVAILFWTEVAASGNSLAQQLLNRVQEKLGVIVQESSETHEPTEVIRSIDDAIEYVLQKNHELYKRLA